MLLKERKGKSLSRVRLFETPWTVAYQASQSMGFSSQEYWSGLPFPSPGDLSDSGIEPEAPTLQVDALPSKLPGKLDILFYYPIFWGISDVSNYLLLKIRVQ